MMIDILQNIEPKKAEIGIEIEVSGRKLGRFPHRGVPSCRGWKAVQDHSIKGLEGVEYVLKLPIYRKDVKGELQSLFNYIKNTGGKIQKEDTAGIHIHINIQDLSFKQFINYIILYYIYEESFIQYCGESRVGNHFCLGLGDADYTLNLLTRAITTNSISVLQTDIIRYSSLNLTSLFKFGTLEFRGFRSTPRISSINKWISILLKLKDKAMSYDNPIEIVEAYSQKSGKSLFNEILGKSKIPYVESVESMYRVLDLIYCVDWNNFDYGCEKTPPEGVLRGNRGRVFDELDEDDFFRDILPVPVVDDF